MHRLAPSLSLVVALLSALSARADEYYVATTGADQNPGSLDQPFATVARAQMAAAAGDTVWIRGGLYQFAGTTETTGVAFTKSGARDQPIRYFAYAGETPIFDMFERKPQARVTGLDVHCNWIHLRGLEVRGVRQIVVGDSWGVRVRGDNNVIERLHVHDNEAPGVFITSGANNLILNCDSHHNYDPLEDGGNSDGFGCHSTGEGNVLRGCRAWENSDDGYDFINAAGACTVERSWAFRNGYIPDTDKAAANGAGFKSGGYGFPPNTPASGPAHHVIRFNLAFRNRVIGFYANFHPGGLDFINNTAFDNPANFDMRTPGTPSSHTLRNNVAAGSGQAIINFNGGTDDYNSWTLPVMVSSADFESLDQALATAPRKPDGSLPAVLAQLRADSDLIDRGEDRGFAFAGAAPDLGAFEVGLGRDDDADAGVAPGTAATTAPPAMPAASAGRAAQVQAGMSGSARAGSGAPMQPRAAGTAPARPQTGTVEQQTSAATASGADTSPRAAGCGCRAMSGQRSSAVSFSTVGAVLVLFVWRRVKQRSRSERRA